MDVITELFAAEQLKTAPKEDPQQGLIKSWQDTLKQQQTSGMPAHTVDVSKPPEKDPLHDAMRSVFLQQAAGGPKEGFTTKNPRSHAVAMSLARTGHLKHVGQFKHANNNTVHHWQLTQKGMEATQTAGAGGFPVKYPKQQQPNNNAPGQQPNNNAMQKPGQQMQPKQAVAARSSGRK